MSTLLRFDFRKMIRENAMKLPRRRFLHMAAGAAALPALSHTARAQAVPKTGTRLITLGTPGGPNPRVRQANSSNLLIVNGTFYVVDAGDGVTRRLAKAGDIREIGTIFLTHHHIDHTGSLGLLMGIAWGQNRTKPINVYGPPRTEELVKAAVQYYKINAEILFAEGSRSVPLSDVFFGHDVGTGVVFQDANIKVTAVENSHFDWGGAAGKFKSYSYRFESPDRVIVFTGDTGASDSVTELARGADLLVTETASFEDRMQIDDQDWPLASDDICSAGRNATAGDTRPYDPGNNWKDGGPCQRQNRCPHSPDLQARRRLLRTSCRSEKVFLGRDACGEGPDGILDGRITRARSITSQIIRRCPSRVDTVEKVAALEL
jgi:ribonuclease BN (tRNA processing enzyme)